MNDDNPKPRLLTREELARGRKLIEEAFDGPWRYKQYEIECGACNAYQDGSTDKECSNPECNGSDVPATFVEAPKAYPGESEEYRAQVVATIDVPGFSDLAEKNGEAICWLRNNAEALIEARSQLNEMVAALAWLSTQATAVPVSSFTTVSKVIIYAKSLGWTGGSDA